MSRRDSTTPPVRSRSRRGGTTCWSGVLVVHVGDEEFELEDGDTITYDAATPHYVRNLGKATVHALAAVTPPSF